MLAAAAAKTAAVKSKRPRRLDSSGIRSPPVRPSSSIVRRLSFARRRTSTHAHAHEPAHTRARRRVVPPTQALHPSPLSLRRDQHLRRSITHDDDAAHTHSAGAVAQCHFQTSHLAPRHCTSVPLGTTHQHHRPRARARPRTHARTHASIQHHPPRLTAHGCTAVLASPVRPPARQPASQDVRLAVAADIDAFEARRIRGSRRRLPPPQSKPWKRVLHEDHDRAACVCVCVQFGVGDSVFSVFRNDRSSRAGERVGRQRSRLFEQHFSAPAVDDRRACPAVTSFRSGD